jgi:hypothetical protein
MSKLIRHIFILLFMIAAGFESYGQANSLVPAKPNVTRTKKSGMGAKLEAARNNFISKQLDLSDHESTKFWPLYRQYQQELTAVRILK